MCVLAVAACEEVGSSVLRVVVMTGYNAGIPFPRKVVGVVVCISYNICSAFGIWPRVV